MTVEKASNIRYSANYGKKTRISQVNYWSL